MKKSLSVLILSFILLGCGDAGENLPGNDTAQLQRFKLHSTTWQVRLPENWTAQTDVTGTILVGQAQDQNLIIAQKPGYGPKILEQIQTYAERSFFDFSLESVDENKFIFRGKQDLQDPVRVFHEKIYQVPGTDSYLIAVCSYEHWEGRTSACQTILNSWIIESTNN